MNEENKVEESKKNRILNALKWIVAVGGSGAAGYFGGPAAAQLATEFFTKLFG